MPELDGATEWLQGDPVTREQLLGQPALICFWAVSCYICKDNMPTVRKWMERYPDLQVVSIHRPRQEADIDTEAVRKVVAEYGITEPVALDNNHTVGDRFETGSFWPYYFLFDAEGNLKSRVAGDAGIRLIEGALDRLFAELAPAG
jgi:hypothetical protein